MVSRTRTATVMAFRDQRRRALVPILLVAVPIFSVLWSVALTQPEPMLIGLPGGGSAVTTMKALHGPEMAKFSAQFVAALVGVFLMRSALTGDRRLVVAGYRPGEVVLARLAVLGAATALVVTVSAAVMAIDFTPASWTPVLAALVLTALMYAAIGALAGALLESLPATYLILFLVMTDLVVQSPMFHATPGRFAWLLPGYGPTRMMVGGDYSHAFTAGGPLAISLGWLAVLAIADGALLRHVMGSRAT